MSGGKKKSGFQITSVTLDYGQGSAEPSPQKQSFSGDSSASSLQQAPEVINGVQSMTHSPSLTPRQPGHGPSTTPGRVGGDMAEGAGESGDYRTSPGSGSVVISGGEEVSAVMALVTNGPVRFTPPRTIIQHTSSSQPSTPMSVRKQHSQEQSPQSSRFRVVRLGQGLGEPYKRGRWTCVDYLEREGGEERGMRRVMDSMRHAHSLESLETAGLGGPEGGGAGAALKPLGHLRTLKPGHVVHSQGTTHLRAPRIGGDGGLPSKPSSEEQDDGDSQAEHAAAKPQTLSSGPPSPSHKDRFNVRLVDSSNPPLSHFPGAPLPQHPQDSPLRSPPRYMGEPSPRLRHIPPPLRLDVEAAGRPVFRETQSQPSSPGPHPSRDGVFHHSMNPIQTPSAFSLPQSMFGGPFDPDDESGSGNSMIAIDNKIEQAMDLVKTHLMMAVREEVEVLREQIKELAERNAQLERENYILRALRERD